LINSDSEASFINVLKQFRQLAKEVPVFGNFVGSSKSFRDAVGSLAEGLVYYDVPLLSGQGTDSSLGKEFERVYGVPASSPYMVASSISALRVVREVIRDGGNPRKFLLSNSFESAIGKFRFSEQGDVLGILPSLKMIRSGETVALDN
jgi:ABC-type branched-subunit amino acid transport system substrate-binding protein